MRKVPNTERRLRRIKVSVYNGTQVSIHPDLWWAIKSGQYIELLLNDSETMSLCDEFLFCIYGHSKKTKKEIQELVNKIHKKLKI